MTHPDPMPAEPPTATAPPVMPDTRQSRTLTAIFSIGIFSIIGAWVGHKIGGWGERPHRGHTERFIRWAGAVAGGLLAFASQPKPVPPPDAAQSERALHAAEHRIATTPLTDQAVPQAQVQTDGMDPQGTIDPNVLRRA